MDWKRQGACSRRGNGFRFFRCNIITPGGVSTARLLQLAGSDDSNSIAAAATRTGKDGREYAVKPAAATVNGSQLTDSR
jgi:hypothetical protein